MVQTYFGDHARIAYPGMRGKHEIGQEIYLNNTATLPQIDTFTLVYEDGVTYDSTINGETFSYTSVVGNADTDVRDGLIQAINLSAQEIIAVATSATTFAITGAGGLAYTVYASVTNATTGSLSVANTQAAVDSPPVKIGTAILKTATSKDNQAQLGAVDANHKFIGVAYDAGTMVNDQGILDNRIPVHEYASGELMAIVVTGSVWVRLEEDVTQYSDVYYRYDDAGETGAFRATAAGGCAQVISGARWLSSGKAGQVAELILGI